MCPRTGKLSCTPLDMALCTALMPIVVICQLPTADMPPVHRRLMQAESNAGDGITISAPVFAVFICLLSCCILCPLYAWIRSGRALPRRAQFSTSGRLEEAEGETSNDTEERKCRRVGEGESQVSNMTKSTTDEQIHKLQQVHSIQGRCVAAGLVSVRTNHHPFSARKYTCILCVFLSPHYFTFTRRSMSSQN